MASSGGEVVTEIQIPNFLVKVWNILEDVAHKDSIHWDDSGFSFHIADPLRFSKDVLPLFFKHNNLSSFVRQLNMYGFRKVTPLEKTGLSRAQSDQEHLEFQHAYFVQGHPELLQYIKRKTGSANPTTSAASKEAGAPKGLESVLEEIKRLRERQSEWDSKLNSVKKENGTLWREISHMRSSHLKQQQIVSRLIQFLLSVVPNSGAGGKRLPRRLLLAIGDNETGGEDESLAPSSSKRARPSRGEALNSFLNSPGASASLEALQQELESSGPSRSTGPIIAEVIEEEEQTQPHSVSSPAQINIASPPASSTRLARKRSHLDSSGPTNPMLVEAGGHSYASTNQSGRAKKLLPPPSPSPTPSPSGGPRLEWNIEPPPPATVPAQPPPPPPINRSLSGQDFSDFLNFMDMDMKSIRSNLASVQNETGSETIDQSFLDTLFSDMPDVRGNGNPSATQSVGAGQNVPLSLTAGPAWEEPSAAEEPLFEANDEFFPTETRPLTRSVSRSNAAAATPTPQVYPAGGGKSRKAPGKKK